LRDQAETAFRSHKFGDAAIDRREAFRLDPGSEDLLFIARCYQRDQQPADAAVMALQARQMAQASAPVNAKTVGEASEILRTVDKPMITLETRDKEFIATVETRRKTVESRDKDTAEAMTQLLDKLAKLDAFGSD
jgi:hypothetical protein